MLGEKIKFSQGTVPIVGQGKARNSLGTSKRFKSSEWSKPRPTYVEMKDTRERKHAECKETMKIRCLKQYVYRAYLSAR